RKRLRGQRAHAPDLLAQIVRAAPERADGAKPARVAHRRDELRARGRRHARLDDWKLDPEQVADRRVQPARAHDLVERIANTQSPAPVTHPHSTSSTSQSFARPA